MKRCTKCGLEKDESEFSRHVGQKDGLRTSCRACTSEYTRAWRAANPDKAKAIARKWKAANREVVKVSAQEWRATNPEMIKGYRVRAARKVYEDPVAKAQKMISSSKVRAKKQGIPHSVSYKDLVPIPSVCPVLGTPMSLSGAPINDDMASLDRINNNMGYVPGNVAVISRRANAIKRDATIEELELVLAYMKRHAVQQQQQQQAQQEQQEQEAEPSNT